MVRPFLSLLVAGLASAIGLGVLLFAAQRHAFGIASLSPDPFSDVLMLVGVLVVGVAAGSLLLHWLGALVVGAIHLLLGGLAIFVPVPGLLSGAYSPTWEIVGMLRDLDPALGEGAANFFFSGAAVVLGAFLVGAALAVRSRWDSPPAGRSTAVIASVVGAAALVVAIALLATAGDAFLVDLFSRRLYDFPAALTIAGAAVLAGVGGLTMRWSSAGGILIGAVALLAGVAAIVASTAVPYQIGGTRLLAFGFLPALGISIVVAGVAAARRRSPVPVATEAL